MCHRLFSLEHPFFGMMLGKDMPFKTRSGGTVKLKDLLDEAVERADKLISERSQELTKKKAVVEAAAIGSVKYSDLENRTTDYVFDWDNMLIRSATPRLYMQYAYTRICSIFARSGIDAGKLTGVKSC